MHQPRQALFKSFPTMDNFDDSLSEDVETDTIESASDSGI